MNNSDESREKILLAAAQIFADKGLAGASIRSITKAANVNHALIGYYFGSKVALYQEVLERASDIIGKPKLSRLAELKAEYEGSPIPLREIMDAYIRSFFDDFGIPESVPMTWLRFYGRCFSEGDDEVCNATNKSGEHIRKAFLEELRRTLPDLSDDALIYRMGAMIGAITFWRGETGLLDGHLYNNPDTGIDVPELIEEMITISCAIFRERPATSKDITGQDKAVRTLTAKSIASSDADKRTVGETPKISRRHRRKRINE